MTTPIRINATASVDVDTAYGSTVVFEIAAGLYVGGGPVSEPTLLLWFDGATAADQCEAIDHAIDALAALKREARAARAPAAGDGTPTAAVEPSHDQQPESVAASVDVDDIPF